MLIFGRNNHSLVFQAKHSPNIDKKREIIHREIEATSSIYYADGIINLTTVHDEPKAHDSIVPKMRTVSASDKNVLGDGRSDFFCVSLQDENSLGLKIEWQKARAPTEFP